MKWLRLIVLALLAAGALALLVLLGPLRARTTDAARRYLERELAAVLHVPVAIGALYVTFLPTHIEAEAVTIGANGALARAARVTVRLLPRTSLRQLRPVGDATVDDVAVDIPGWLALLASPSPSAPTVVPPFRLRSVRVTQISVRCSGGPAPLDLGADALDGGLEATPHGRLHFAADMRQVALARHGTTLHLERARVHGGEAADGWRLTAVEVTGDGVQLASAAAQADRLPIRGRIALPRLALASEMFERLGGDVEVDAALIGPLDRPAAAGRLAVTDLTVDGERVGDVSARAEWTPERLTVSGARLAVSGGEVEGRGELALTAPFGYGVRLRGSSIDLRGLAHLDPQAIAASATNGHAELSGTLAPLVARGAGRGTLVGTAGGAPMAWRGRGSYRGGAGTVELSLSQGRANTLAARLAIGPERALSGSLDAAVGDPNALGAVLPIASVSPLRGSLTASATIAGTTDDPRFTGQLAGRAVALLGVNIESLSGGFTVDRRALRSTGIQARLWQGSIGLGGTVALDPIGTNAWQVRADGVPGDAVVAVASVLGGAVPPIGGGTFTAHVEGSGPWTGIHITGDARMTGFWLGSEWIEEATLRGSTSWPRWEVDGKLRNRVDQTVELHGSGSAAAAVALRANSAGWDLTAVERATLGETGGRVAMDAAVAGPLRALSGHAAAQSRQVIVHGRQVGAIDVDATATEGRWQVTASLLDGALGLRGTLSPATSWPFSVEGEWTDARLGQLLVPGGNVQIESTGTLRLEGRLTAVDQLDATLRVQALRIANGPFQLATVEPATLQCRRGACALDRFSLRGADTELRVDGTIAGGGGIRLTVSGQGDLRALELVGDPIESARGRFTVDAAVNRSAAHWDVSGQVSFDDAALDVGAPVAITRASGRLSLAGSMVHVDRFGGRMGTGTFELGGALDLTQGPNLTWTMRDVGADLLPSLEAELSGRGSLSGTWEHMRLAGQIDVARLLYDRDIELTDFLPSLNRSLQAPRPRSARRFDLDLRILAPGELYVENNLARIEARADLHLTGPADHPVLDGRIEALDGTVAFRARTFELEGATVDFRPDLGLTAALNITAESVIETPDATYTVGVQITGTTADPRVTLSADDPALTQTDIATLITMGQTTAQLRESGGGGFSVYDALGMIPTKPLEQGAKQLLPIDRISFESTYSRTTGTFEPQIKLGKDLTDNLALSVGRTFGIESRTIAEADYRLTQHFFIPLSWESQTDTQEGAFAGGVKVRYEFWRLTPYTLLGAWR